MDLPDILLMVLILIQTATMVGSIVQLVRYRESYPIKQLSPRVTIMISVAAWLSCLLLAIVQFTGNGKAKEPNNFVIICNLFYVFFREVTILGFSLRILRICIAYYKRINCRPVMAVFRSQGLLCLVTCAFSMLLPIIQVIEYYGFGRYPSEFFHFFSKSGAGNPFNYVLWSIDNGLFFVVVALSLPVTEKFKFIGQLVIVFLAAHCENWYKLTWLILKSKGTTYAYMVDQMEDRFYFMAASVNVLCMFVLVWPTLRPTYELPLPNDAIIGNHNMLFQHSEAYTILYQFARHLENVRSSHEQNEKRQHACRYLHIYTELLIARRTVAKANYDKSTIDIDEPTCREFLEKFVIPNFNELELIQNTTKNLFKNGVASKDQICDGLSIDQLMPLYGKLQRVMNYIYCEWKHTKSMLALREELEGNSPIIKKMFELHIGIT